MCLNMRPQYHSLGKPKDWQTYVREDFLWSSKVMLNIKQIDGIYVLLCKKKREEKEKKLFLFF